MREEEDGIKRNEREGVQTAQLDQILNSDAYKCRRTSLFYRAFDRNRPIETIDDYDGTVHRGPFQISRSRMIVIKGSDRSTDKRLKNALDRVL